MSSEATQKRFTGWHMLALILAFFGVIIGANIWLAVVAVGSWTGVVVDDDYAAGQAFEANRLAHEAQVAANWAARFTYEDGVAHLTVVDVAGAAIDLGMVTLSVRRPIGEKDDRLLTMQRSSDGSAYEARVDLPAGTWDAIVTAPETAKGPFKLSDRFTTGGSP